MHAFDQEDGDQAGEDGEGNEIGAQFEAHDDEAGIHLEVEQEHRDEEHVDHVPFVDRLETEELPARGQAQHQLDILENRQDECKYQDDGRDEVVAALPEHPDRIEERHLLAPDLEAQHLVACRHQRIDETQDIERHRSGPEHRRCNFPGLQERALRPVRPAGVRIHGAIWSAARPRSGR